MNEPNEGASNKVTKSKRLAFMLSQLRDDLDEIIAQLEGGVLDPDMAASAAATQLHFVLNQLSTAGDK